MPWKIISRRDCHFLSWAVNAGPFPDPGAASQSQEDDDHNLGRSRHSSRRPKLPNDQLDSLVAPIALYPDSLLAQTLAASTYPLEVIQLQQWMGRNKDLKDKALADAVAKQPWDPKRPVNGNVSRRRSADGGQYPMDD